MLAPKFVVFIAFFCLSDAVITGWVTPNIGASTGSGSISTAIPENTAVGTKTSISIEATDGSAGSITYAIGKQDPAGLFTIDSGNGDLSIAAALDFETNPNPVIEVAAEVGGNSETATVTLTVGDVDDESPTFTTKSVQVCLADHTAKGTSVTTVTATDKDKQSTIAYSIKAGKEKADFAIASNNGTVTVAKALNGTKTPSYNLTIEASDSARKATMFLVVKVGGCVSQRSSAVVMAPLGLLTMLVALLTASM